MTKKDVLDWLNSQPIKMGNERKIYVKDMKDPLSASEIKKEIEKGSEVGKQAEEAIQEFLDERGIV